MIVFGYRSVSPPNGDLLSQIEKHIVVSAFSLTGESSTILGEPKVGPKKVILI